MKSEEQQPLVARRNDHPTRPKSLIQFAGSPRLSWELLVNRAIFPPTGDNRDQALLLGGRAGPSAREEEKDRRRPSQAFHQIQTLCRCAQRQ